MGGEELDDGDAEGELALDEDVLPELAEDEDDVLDDELLATTEGDGSALDGREVLRLEELVVLLDGGGVGLKDLGEEGDGRAVGLELVVERDGLALEDVLDELELLKVKLAQTEETKKGIRTTVGEDNNGLVVGTIVL